jgi:hypothetical protein
LYPVDNVALRTTIEFVRDVNADSLVKKDLVENLKTNQAQPIFPYIFVGAPSGTGKTTFALNLGCDNIPTIYALFSEIWDIASSRQQEVYIPFFGISKLIQKRIASF